LPPITENKSDLKLLPTTIHFQSIENNFIKFIKTPRKISFSSLNKNFPIEYLDSYRSNNNDISLNSNRFSVSSVEDINITEYIKSNEIELNYSPSLEKEKNLNALISHHKNLFLMDKLIYLFKNKKMKCGHTFIKNLSLLYIYKLKTDTVNSNYDLNHKGDTANSSNFENNILELDHQNNSFEGI
ncbi:MAG: hypothetical protein MJ252_06005, partial [archaeon]|nr:hypothetical protein [archaeon]